MTQRPMTQHTVTLELIKTYLEKGWSVIPSIEKHPIVPWKEYQEKQPTVEQWEEWLEKTPHAQVGIVTGHLTGIISIDLDIGYKEEDFKDLKLPPTVVTITPSGGQHWYFKTDKADKIKTCAGFRQNIDIRAKGGFSVLPPSVTTDGRKYQWKVSPEMADIADLPEHVYNKLEKNSYGSSTDFSKFIKGAPQGSRNQSAAQLAGLLIRYLPPKHWNSVAWRLVRLWNQQNTPPLDDRELLNVFNSICKKEFAKQYGNTNK